MDDNRARLFSEAEIQKWMDVFDVDLYTRIVMAVARRSERPWSAVDEEWSYDDLLKELAWDRQQLIDAEARCPGCNIHPREMFVAGTKDRVIAENTPWKLSSMNCPFCNERDEMNHKAVNEGVRDASKWKANPRRWAWTARLKGQPFVPDMRPIQQEQADQRKAAAEAASWQGPSKETKVEPDSE